jgi:serine/threonine-protein kinase
LSPRLEDRFGITREFLVLCTDVTDLQPRHITSIRRLIRTAEHAIEPDFAMVVTNDPGAAAKIRDWAVERTEGIVVVPLTGEELALSLQAADASLALPRFIEQWLASQNLYDQRDPVTGERFYGRADLLRDLDRSLASGGSHVGLFGLRRIGKTSLLLELQARLARRPAVTPLFLDLERSTESAHVAARLGEELAAVLAGRSDLSLAAARRALALPDDWRALPAEIVIADLGDRLSNALRYGALAEHRLIVMLDEAEILLPSVNSPKSHVLELLRVFRAVAQETRQLTLVLAGVNATPSESTTLAGEDNPLFGLLSIEYLGPLSSTECHEMIRGLGKKMQIRWDGPAIDKLVELVGAHPLLARLAASDVATMNPQRPLRPNLEMVDAAMRDFHRRRSDVFSQMVDSLRKYYPDEYDFLGIVAAGDIAFASAIADESPTILNHLHGYGVLDPEHLWISNPVFEKWLRLAN